MTKSSIGVTPNKGKVSRSRKATPNQAGTKTGPVQNATHS